MRFVFGFVSGVIVGAAAAVLYSVQTGRDLREEYEQVRGDIQNRDMEALGARLENRFRELQAVVEDRIAQAREAAEDQAEEASEAAAEAADAAAEAIEEAAEEARES